MSSKVNYGLYSEYTFHQQLWSTLTSLILKWNLVLLANEKEFITIVDLFTVNQSMMYVFLH